MLEKFLNKKVKITVILQNGDVYGGTVPDFIEGILEDFDDKFIMLSENRIYSLKYISSIKLSK